ncbi:MAG: aminotransferase class V-fold PLP-dependent enzyme [Candidatus Eisenbacteria bacterium]|nr:aminotransferase class V-fold PLP-dependent enzyme [Candidatus Eisenbacteria bacterium]
MTDARGSAGPIYLDHNATTPVAGEVIAAVARSLEEDFGNPSSAHPYGRRAAARIQTARGQVAALLGCAPEEVVFTSGGSEANNLALRGVAELLGSRLAGLVISAVEHPAVVKPARWLQERGLGVRIVPVDRHGRVDPRGVCEACDALARNGGTVLVSIMHANNEVGTLQPIAEIAREVRGRGGVMHTDAAKSAGKVAVDVSQPGIDLLSIAAHKFYGPKGVGALYIRQDIRVAPQILGAAHERGLRAGTENTPGIVGLGEACRLAAESLPEDRSRIASLRDRFWARLQEEIPGILRNGHPQDVLPNTLNVSFPGALGRRVLEECPGVAAATGAACHSGVDHPSAVLTAMGVPEEEALGTVRLSLGRATQEADVDAAAGALVSAWRTVSAG